MKQIDKPEWVEVGVKTTGMISTSIALWELQRQGRLDFKYGEKLHLAQSLGISPRALDRALAAVADAQPRIEALLANLDAPKPPPQPKQPQRRASAPAVSPELTEIAAMKQRLAEMELDLLSQRRYEEMSADPALAIPFEGYQKMLAAEGLA